MDPDQRRKLIVGIFTAIFMVVFLTISFLINRRRKKMMRMLADELGLQLVGGTPYYPKIVLLWWSKKPIMVLGPTGKHFVVFKHLHIGKSTYHAFSMTLKSGSKMRLMIQANGIMSKIAITPSMKKVDTGDPLFDSHIAIRSSNPELAAVIFSTPEVKRAFLETWKKEKPSGRVEAQDGTIHYKRSGGLSNEAKVHHMSAMIRTVSLLADAVDAASDVTRSATKSR